MFLSKTSSQLGMLLLGAVFALSACAADDSASKEYQAGVDYKVLSTPVPTRDRNKIEVTEFFWYGCGHCYKFEPMVQQWKKTLADDVAFHHSPAVWNQNMEIHAKAYYTAETLGVLDQVNMPIFNAMHIEKKPLSSEAELAELFAKYGVSKEDFHKAFTSFGVNSQLRQAQARARGAMIEGTPEMMVNGKYRVSASIAGGHEGMLKVVNYLIEKERQAANAN